MTGVAATTVAVIFRAVVNTPEGMPWKALPDLLGWESPPWRLVVGLLLTGWLLTVPGLPVCDRVS